MGAVAASLAMQLEARRGRAQLLVLQPLGYTTSPLCPPEAVQLLLQTLPQPLRDARRRLQ